jgi:hypothetical protein
MKMPVLCLCSRKQAFLKYSSVNLSEWEYQDKGLRHYSPL